MAWVVFENNSLKKELLKLVPASNRFIEPPDLKFKVEVSMNSKVDKKLSKDPLLNQKLRTPVQKEFERIVRQLGMMYKAYNKEISKLLNKQDAKIRQKKFESIYKEQVSTAKKFAISAMNKVWAEFIKKEKDYSKYKIKVGAKIAMGIVSLATSIASMAAAPFSGGASAVVSIAGMVKTASSIAQECRKAAISVEKAQKELEKNLKVVLVSYKKASKTSLVAKELASHYVNTVLTVQMPSIKSAGDKLKLVRNKLNGIQLNSHKIAKELDKALKKSMSIKKKLSDRNEAKLEKLAKRVMVMIPKIHKNEGRADKALKKYDAAAPVVKGLMDKRPKWLGKVEMAMQVLNYAGAGDWSDVIQTTAEIAGDITVDALLD